MTNPMFAKSMELGPKFALFRVGDVRDKSINYHLFLGAAGAPVALPRLMLDPTLGGAACCAQRVRQRSHP